MRLISLLILSITVGALSPGPAAAQSTIDPVNSFSYGANIGWVNWRPDSPNGAVAGEYVCSGYLYGANVGWINLGSGVPGNGIQYQNNSATDYGVNHDGTGNLRGYAWGANIGWINFESLGSPKIDLKSGILSGYVWGANIGWISLSNAFGFVQSNLIKPGADVDGDGITDAYELTWMGNLASMTAASDQDGDGVSDLGESIAGTNPLDPSNYFQIQQYAFNSTLTQITLSWSSVPTRVYQIQKRTNLSPLSTWADISLDLICPDPGPSTTVTFSNSPSVESYYQVRVAKPLSP